MKLNWLVPFVGLVASLISIFAFLTGASSLSGMVKKPAPQPQPQFVLIPPDPTQLEAKPKPDQRKTPGDMATAPIKNAVNWGVGRITPRHPSRKAETPAATPESSH